MCLRFLHRIHLVRHNVASSLDGHDVRVLREDLEQHWTVVLAITVLGEIQLDE